MENKTLAEIKNHFHKISSDWDGEEKVFTSGGMPYTEEDASLAADIVDHITSLEAMIESTNF